MKRILIDTLTIIAMIVFAPLCACAMGAMSKTNRTKVLEELKKQEEGV